MLCRALCSLLGGLLAAAGCASNAAGPDNGEPPDYTPGAPGLGAHSITFHRVGTNPPVLSTRAMTTASAGSTFIVSVGRGDFSAFDLPTDNKGNGPYEQLGEPHTYTLWPSSGTALYAATSMAGGPDHVVQTSTPPSDEITLAAVEVIEGTHVQDFTWTEVLKDRPLKSLPVTTTGPATLVAFWWGDASVANDKTAVPNNGFTVIDSVLASGELVQCAVAARKVSAAGTYDVTWTATPKQGAQLWLVAVQ
jgi:hypothetical protein